MLLCYLNQLLFCVIERKVVFLHIFRVHIVVFVFLFRRHYVVFLSLFGRQYFVLSLTGNNNIGFWLNLKKTSFLIKSKNKSWALSYINKNVYKKSNSKLSQAKKIYGLGLSEQALSHCISIVPKLECIVRTPDLKWQFSLISPSNRKMSPKNSSLYFSYDAIILL